jgi:hypothetical protein
MRRRHEVPRQHRLGDWMRYADRMVLALLGLSAHGASALVGVYVALAFLLALGNPAR